MPEVSRFFGIVIRMYFDDHRPPHFHAEYAGKKAVFDFHGNIIGGGLSSKTATKLVREWTDLHTTELEENWRHAQTDGKVAQIDPLT